MRHLPHQIPLIPKRLGRVMQFVARDLGFEHHTRTLHNYHPRPFPGRLSLFVPRFSYQRLQLGRRKWNQVAQGGLDVHVIGGDHENFIRPPHIETLARTIVHCLRQLEATRAHKPIK